MNKIVTKLALITSLTFSVNTFAEQNYQGHRVGFGISSGEIDYIQSDLGSVDIGRGIKLEYGYDINRIVGVNISLDKNKDNESDYGITWYESDVSAFKVDTDIGYAFFTEHFTIKPYFAIGVARVKDKTKILGDSFTSTETALLLGSGVRATFDFGLYVDLRANMMMLDDYDVDQISLTAGYKF